ncbi:MAG: endonuclease V [Bacteroidia bacterium]|nr:endonuclease V [Bacteroidia bacterium]
MNWLENAKKEQEEMMEALTSEPVAQFQPEQVLFTFDVQYVEDTAHVGIDLQYISGEPIAVYVCKEHCEVPYLPGYFAFREGPVILHALGKTILASNHKPALLLIDGHGMAHPRMMGVASWVGIKSGFPSIGVAKEPLLKQEYKLEKARGSVDRVILNGTLVGHVVRSQEGIKPLFVSAGYQVDQQTARKMALSWVGNYRNLEPIRRADQAARAYAKNAPLKESIII